MGKLRILIAEDHETVREGLKLILQSQSDVEIVGEAADGTAAVESAKRLLPDVVLMDVSMPRTSGLRATKLLRECCPEVKILALTRHNDGAYLQEMLRAGASGYVLKQSSSSELLRAIREIASGNSYLDPALSGKVVEAFAGRTIKKTAPANVSNRELEVLKAIAWGYSNKEIAARLKLSVKTVEAHKANSMKKLDLRSRIDIVRYAVLQGWLGSN
ncbi:MAG TPA: response regulator transcription factor [Pyrinomonadaceae bacterium]|jgi:DNA-binding NarL/FixJ family response regulator